MGHKTEQRGRRSLQRQYRIYFVLCELLHREKRIPTARSLASQAIVHISLVPSLLRSLWDLNYLTLSPDAKQSPKRSIAPSSPCDFSPVWPYRARDQKPFADITDLPQARRQRAIPLAALRDVSNIPTLRYVQHELCPLFLGSSPVRRAYEKILTYPVIYPTEQVVDPRRPRERFVWEAVFSLAGGLFLLDEPFFEHCLRPVTYKKPKPVFLRQILDHFDLPHSKHGQILSSLDVLKEKDLIAYEYDKSRSELAFFVRPWFDVTDNSKPISSFRKLQTLQREKAFNYMQLLILARKAENRPFLLSTDFRKLIHDYEGEELSYHHFGGSIQRMSSWHLIEKVERRQYGVFGAREAQDFQRSDYPFDASSEEAKLRAFCEKRGWDLNSLAAAWQCRDSNTDEARLHELWEKKRKRLERQERRKQREQEDAAKEE